MPLGNAPVLRIERGGLCARETNALGLVHQQLDLECALRIAHLTSRVFEMWPLTESPMQTNCSGAMVNTSWASILDLSGQPMTFEDAGPTDERRPFNMTAIAAGDLGSSRVVELQLGKWGMNCNFYQACDELPAEVPRVISPSASVRAATQAVQKSLGREYAGVHLRQGDKATTVTGDRFSVPRFTPRQFGQLLKVLLTARERNSAVYVATNDPELATNPCASACFGMHTFESVRPQLLPHAPADVASRLQYDGCNPYWVAAVDLALLEESSDIVYSDASNMDRLVAVRRRQRFGPEPLHFMSLNSLPPLPETATASALEMSYMRGNISASIPVRSRQRLNVGLLQPTADEADSAIDDLARWGTASTDQEMAARLRELTARHDPATEPECAQAEELECDAGV